MNKETKTITYYKPTLVLTTYPPQYEHPDGTIRLYPPEPEIDFKIEVPMDYENSKKLQELMNKVTNESAKATVTFQYKDKEENIQETEKRKED